MERSPKYKERLVEDDLLAEESLEQCIHAVHKMKYEINKKLLRKVKEHDNFCLCEIGKICPCEEFLKKDVCICGVFKKI